jgi:hypothetical protein
MPPGGARNTVEKTEGFELLAGRIDDFPGQGDDFLDVPHQRPLTRDQLPAQVFVERRRSLDAPQES